MLYVKDLQSLHISGIAHNEYNLYRGLAVINYI